MLLAAQPFSSEKNEKTESDAYPSSCHPISGKHENGREHP